MPLLPQITGRWHLDLQVGRRIVFLAGAARSRTPRSAINLHSGGHNGKTYHCARIEGPILRTPTVC